MMFTIFSFCKYAFTFVMVDIRSAFSFFVNISRDIFSFSISKNDITPSLFCFISLHMSSLRLTSFRLMSLLTVSMEVFKSWFRVFRVYSFHPRNPVCRKCFCISDDRQTCIYQNKAHHEFYSGTVLYANVYYIYLVPKCQIPLELSPNLSSTAY